MLDIEQAIREVGTVYQALTGRPIEAGRSDLPPEIDGGARAHVEERYRQFKSMIDARAAAPAWVPALAVIEREHEVRYEIDLPAVSRDQVGVSLLGGFLVVSGQREGGPAHYAERPAGVFQRVIALPLQARRDGITASLRDGVLAIDVPIDGPSGGPLAVEIR
jgi:HSP20 family molecular chaperone IbpA